MLLGLCLFGCHREPEQPADYDYPAVPPIWIVEDDPRVTIYDRKDLQRDREVGPILVIPLYMDYEYDGATDFLAVAHPFVYQPGDDIENQLAALPQREKLRRLLFWVPGYFPDGMGRTFTWVPIINGKRMVVVELQRCLGSEEDDINAAMKTLLEDDFLVGRKVLLTPPPPPYTNEIRMTDEPYDAYRLVRSMEYQGRFFNHQCPENTHVLWAFPPGTRIVNHLSVREKKTTAMFAEQVMQKGTKQPAADAKEPDNQSPRKDRKGDRKGAILECPTSFPPLFYAAVDNRRPTN